MSTNERGKRPHSPFMWFVLATALPLNVLQAEQRGVRGNWPRKPDVLQGEAAQPGDEDVAAVADDEAELQGYRRIWQRKPDMIQDDSTDLGDAAAVADGQTELQGYRRIWQRKPDMIQDDSTDLGDAAAVADGQTELQGYRRIWQRKPDMIQDDSTDLGDAAAVADGEAELRRIRSNWLRKLDVLQGEPAQPGDEDVAAVADGHGNPNLRFAPARSNESAPDLYPTPAPPIDPQVSAVPGPIGACCFLTHGEFDCVDVRTKSECYNDYGGSLALGLHCFEACCSDDECIDGEQCSIAACVEGVCEYEKAATCCLNADDCPVGDACTIVECVYGACEYSAVNCDDGRYCNGLETCDPVLGCLYGTPPSCDDGVARTKDSCDAVRDACAHRPIRGHSTENVACAARRYAPPTQAKPATLKEKTGARRSPVRNRHD